MILHGEAQCARQIVTVSNSEGKIIAYAKPRYPLVRIKNCKKYLPLSACFQLLKVFWFKFQVKGSDTSTAESGSDAEDTAYPRKSGNYFNNPPLTPVREEVSSSFLQVD